MCIRDRFLIFANGFFVAAEFALVKVRSTQLEIEVQQGNRLAGLARLAWLGHDGSLSGPLTAPGGCAP